jgi:hypothetical protein
MIGAKGTIARRGISDDQRLLCGESAVGPVDQPGVLVRRREGASVATAGAVTAAGALACAAASIASLWLSEVPEHCTVVDIDQETWRSCKYPHPGGLAAHLARNDMRGGVVLAVGLLALSLVLLSLRLVRVRSVVTFGGPGSRVMAVAAARAVIPGTMLAPAGYMLLWFALSGTRPPGQRWLPEHPWPGLASWPVVAVTLVGLAM